MSNEIGTLRTSPSIGAIAPAFATAQKHFRTAVKDSRNPYFNSRYADLGQINEAIEGALHDAGIGILQPATVTGTPPQGLIVVVTTVLMHASGEWFASDLSLPVIPMVTKEGKELRIGPQAIGSAVSYARRYGLAAMCGVITGDDDDGEHAEGRYDGHRDEPPPHRQQRNREKPATTTAPKETAKAASPPAPPQPAEDTIRLALERVTTPEQLAQLMPMLKAIPGWGKDHPLGKLYAKVYREMHPKQPGDNFDLADFKPMASDVEPF